MKQKRSDTLTRTIYCMVVSIVEGLLCVIDSGMIIVITKNMKSYPGLPMLGYFIQTSEYHMIFKAGGST